VNDTAAWGSPAAARGGLHLAARGSPAGRARLPPELLQQQIVGTWSIQAQYGIVSRPDRGSRQTWPGGMAHVCSRACSVIMDYSPALWVAIRGEARQALLRGSGLTCKK